MNDRQTFAHAHPLARADGDVAPFREIRRVAAGVMVSVLTVNR